MFSKGDCAAEKGSGVMSGIYSYRDMKRDLRKLSLKYQGLLKVFWLAKTADGNRIYGIRLGNPAASKNVVIQASMHGREWLNTELLICMVKRCCRRFRIGCYHGKSYQVLFGEVCFWILPMVNPDGVAVSQYGAEGLRSICLQRLVKELSGKDAKFWKANARGVDLNRNYSTGFGASAAKYRGSAEYAGKTPFSERETRALVKLILKIKPQAVLNYHETGHLIYYKNDSRLVQTVHALTGYKLCKEGQECNGNLGDWLTERGIDWCTLETCVKVAPVCEKQLLHEWKRHRNMLPAIAEMFCQV